MGATMLRAALSTGVIGQADVVVCEVVAERRTALEAEYGVRTSASLLDGAADAGVVILAIKPQDLDSLARSGLETALVVSIMAGVPIPSIKAATGSDRIVRVMPNTPAAIGAGMSVWTATTAVSDEERAFVGELLRSMGKDLYVESESKIDMATAVNGSGPGFVFLLMEAMVDGAVDAGLPRDQAEALVLQTFYGSAKYAMSENRNLSELRALVTSPAGTTAAGLRTLEEHGVRAALAGAVRAAHQRAQELGRRS